MESKNIETRSPILVHSDTISSWNGGDDKGTSRTEAAPFADADRERMKNYLFQDSPSEIAREQPSWMSMSISDLEAIARQANFGSDRRAEMERILEDKKIADLQPEWENMPIPALEALLCDASLLPNRRTMIQWILDGKKEEIAVVGLRRKWMNTPRSELQQLLEKSNLPLNRRTVIQEVIEQKIAKRRGYC